MMRSKTPIICAVALVLLSASSGSAKPKASSATAKSAAGPKRASRKTNPAPASQPRSLAPADSEGKTGCEYMSTSTKRCFVNGASAVFDVKISKLHPIFVTLDEKALLASPANDPYIKIQVKDDFVGIALRGDTMPAGHALVVRTETMTITFRLQHVLKGGDSQVHVVRSDRAGIDRMVEARIAAREAELEKEHVSRLRALGERARRLSQEHTLDQIFAGGAEIWSPKGATIARNDFLVLRALKVIRVGNSRFLQVSVENRDGEIFQIEDITASLSQVSSGAVALMTRCTSTTIRPAGLVNCTLGLGEVDRKKGRAKVALRVDGVNHRRHVSLSGVDVR